MTAEPQRHYYIKTYGCQMNVYDSDRMADILAERGMTATDSPEQADLILLNTCHIREKAAEKVYSEIGRLRRIRQQRANDGKDTIIAVAGCVAQAEGEAMVARAPIVDLVVGPQAYHRLGALLARTETRPGAGRKTIIDTDFPPEDKFTALPQRRRHGASSAFLTVQEGCDKFCTFCVVPYTRGAESSRPVATVIDEARELVASGVREITLLGQNVNAYHGADRNGAACSLATLIRRLAEIGGLDRIRYTTSHPRDMDQDLIAAHAEVPALMPYLHLPVQSGSDRILRAMNRGHGRDDYLDIIARLRAARPDLALSGDFIVGFPGETEDDFTATLSLVEAVGYGQAYSFKYSPRPGTPAADQGGQVAEDIKADRLARLQELLGRQQNAFNRASVGKTVLVLFERQGRKPGQLVGRSPWMQAVHCTLSAERAVALHGQIRMVTLNAAGPNSMAGVLADGLSDHKTDAGDPVAAAASGGL